MTDFTPWPAAVGGLLIGLSAVILLRTTGHIAGISGILSRLWPPYEDRDLAIRLSFLAGIAAAPLMFSAATGTAIPLSVTGNVGLLAVGGFLVGYGAVRGGGCTSGHGVCGIARLSPRSIVATLVFMGVAGVTVYVARHIVGG